jgi:hypothetical protein
MFIRKIGIDFSDDVLIKYIWREKNNNNFLYFILLGCIGLGLLLYIIK